MGRVVSTRVADVTSEAILVGGSHDASGQLSRGMESMARTAVTMATCCWCQAPLVEQEGVWWCGGSDACRSRQTAFASQHQSKQGVREWLYVPTPVQAQWHEATLLRGAKHVGVGGAAGPGKSRFGRETLFWFARKVPGLHALLLRKTHKDLDQSHLRFLPHEVAQRGGRWKVSERIAVFPHPGQPDSIIRAGHMESSGDVENYLSSEYDIIFPDELVTFDRDPMLELFSRARTTNKAMFTLRGQQDSENDDRLDGSFVLTATNPGGRGSLWVRDFFVTKGVDRSEFPRYNPNRWVFFQARLEDNPYMAVGYREALENLPEMRRRQLLDGDWNAYEGQFFSEWRSDRHVVDVPLVKKLEWFASMDWGYNAPGCVLWWACLPDGRYHIAREYKFSGQTSEEVAVQIRRVTKSLGIKRLRYLSCDPAMWQKTGAGRGEAIAETLIRHGLPARKSDNDRFNGWLRCHELLRCRGTEEPWITVSPSCTYLTRTVPAMLQDKHDPDDMDTTGDDHAVDALRYGAMSRPSPTRITTRTAFPTGSVGWWREWDRSRGRNRGALA
jgi:phage terminase large subunit